jgi:hypothetical protein
MKTENRVPLGTWLRRNLGAAFVLGALLGLLGLSIRFMIIGWNSTEAPMDVHGWIALTLGVFFSCVVGFGLMGLIFFSSRKGYDEPPTYTQYNEDQGSSATEARSESHLGSGSDKEGKT